MLRALNNRYQIQKQVGSGGMAEVYRADDELLGRTVAIKVLKQEFAQDQSFLSRFMQEARSAARLSHPNIVGVYDVGRDGDLQYIVMEYVEGTTLKEIIQREGALSIPRVVALGRQICAGLAFAHAKGIIHRDIKPQNIMVNLDGVAKIADFGIARALGQATLSEPGQVFGSVHYLSPEQARGEPATEASDVYSLGIILYEMLSGQLPFHGDTVIEVAMKHVQEEAVPLSALNPRVPPLLERLVHRALAKEPEARWRTAAELGKALKEYGEMGESQTSVFNALAARPAPRIAAAWAGPPAATIPPGGAAAVAVKRAPKKTARKIDWLLVILSILTVACLIGLVVVGTEVYRTYANDLFPNGFPNLLGITAATAAPTETAVTRATSTVPPTEKPKVAVPRVENLPAAAAKDLIQGLGFRYVESGREFSNAVPAESVIRQSPPPNQMLASGETVSVVVSKGREVIEVPRVLGMRSADAQADLEKAGFVVNLRKEWNSNTAVDLVFEQSPQPGTPWKRGDTVNITASRGQEMAVVPNVVGMPEEKAKEEILKAKLRNYPWVNYQDNKDLPKDVLERVGKGCVLSVTPAPGTEVPIGTEIKMAVRKKD